MKFNKLGFLTAVVAAGTSANALSVLTPSAQWWWQTGDEALLEWDCSDKTYPTFGVLVYNNNTQILPGNTMNLVAIQNNDQCNINIIPTLNVGTGYEIHLTNPVNISDIYASSQSFEVKAKGSAYPSIPTPAIPNGATPAAASGAGASSTTAASHTGAGFAQASFTLGGALALVGSVMTILGA